MTPQEKEDAKRISRVMRAARKVLGKNQTEVSRSIGVSQSALSKMENGILIPSVSQWHRFCQLANIHSSDAFSSGNIDHALPVLANGAYPDSNFKIPKAYQHHAASKVRITKPFFHFFQELFGNNRLEQYLEQRGMDPDFFIVLDHQLNINFILDMARELIRMGLLKGNSISRLTSSINQPLSHGILHRDYDHSDCGVSLVKSLINNMLKYEANFDHRIEEHDERSLVISVTPASVMKEFDYKDDVLGNFLCRFKASYLKRFSTYRNCPSCEIEETECHFRGAQKCVYRISAA